MNETDEYHQYKNRKLYENRRKLSWSNTESVFRNRKYLRRPNLLHQNIPLSAVFHLRLLLSPFGRFMQCFNKRQTQSFHYNLQKLDIEKWDYCTLNWQEGKQWTRINDFVDDNIFNMLEDAVHHENVIDYEYFYKNLSNLRLTGNEVTEIDSLRNYSKLEILILAYNWLKDIDGKNLPRNLKFLECYANEIKDLKNLFNNSPRKICYLGLGRNLLTEDSSCHLLASSGKFKYLQLLDLANNDIGSLVNILEQLKDLQYLLALALEGNPCYACKPYKECVIKYFPNLTYLDNTEILASDRIVPDDCNIKEESLKGALIFTCYRLIGIPPPPPGKLVTHYFHLEIKLPLLEQIDFPNIGKSESITKKLSKKIPILPNPVKGKGIYALPDEYEIEVKNQIINKNLKTDPQPWNKIIKFNSPAVIVEAPDNDLSLLRDTLKSRVQVNIIYQQKVKSKPPINKSRKSRSSIQVQNVEEHIIKKTTIATFYCDLKLINWSDSYVDYIWAKSPKVGDTAIRVEGSLQPECYIDSSVKKPKPNKKNNSDETQKTPLPTILTCHVGFGLQRCEVNKQSDDNSISIKK